MRTVREQERRTCMNLSVNMIVSVSFAIACTFAILLSVSINDLADEKIRYVTYTVSTIYFKKI